MPPKKRRGAVSAVSKIEDELSSLTTDQLRKELRDIGEEAGPIDSSNK